MRKIKFLAVVSACLLSLSASAQSTSQKSFFSDIQFGVRGGLNFATFKADNGNARAYEGIFAERAVADSYFSSRTTFHVGAVAEKNLWDNFYLQPGLFLTSKGPASSENSDEKLKLLYLELPILLQYHLDTKWNVQFQFGVGPYVAYALNGKLGNSDFNLDILSNDDYSLKFCRFDWGVLFNVGAVYKHIYLGLGYELGLYNIVDRYGINDSDDISLKNRNFYISVGYNF